MLITSLCVTFWAFPCIYSHKCVCAYRNNIMYIYISIQTSDPWNLLFLHQLHKNDILSPFPPLIPNSTPDLWILLFSPWELDLWGRGVSSHTLMALEAWGLAHPGYSPWLHLGCEPLQYGATSIIFKHFCWGRATGNTFFQFLFERSSFHL